jgi:hypothetical protein
MTTKHIVASIGGQKKAAGNKGVCKYVGIRNSIEQKIINLAFISLTGRQ